MFAAQIVGTVTNGTTNKPAAGNQVVLLSLDGGMNEVAKATTDSQGRFAIEVPDSVPQHLLRVNYQSVNYFQNIPPGTTSADITIYDSAKQVAGIFEYARVYTLQSERGVLDVSAMYTLKNESQPPRTKMDEETFEIELPKGAHLVDASAIGPSGLPLPVSPVPTGKNNRYALVFPIRPGEAKFRVSYTVQYSGSYEFSLTPDSSLAELGVLLPKSMQFAGLTRNFSQDSDEAGLAVFFAKDLPAHQPVKFSISGEGVAPREAQAGEAAGAPTSGPPAQSPTGSSSPLLFVMIGMVVVVAVGGVLLWRRSVERTPQGHAAASHKAQQNKSRRTGEESSPATTRESMLET
ncbi:MAG TPA: carboxypeptidase-like regulatory domain-containing protein, partial [Candidatus Angelobacter sp.]|nr:carboxypeptidase-like regulatory domain-containing protein [Candidatus Angelobacter sp.]